jgi:hypothetical protein
MVHARRSLASALTPLCGAVFLGATLLSGGITAAQEPSAQLTVPRTITRTETIPTLSPEQITPELYYYLSELRRHDDPKQAVRRKAELKAAQRNERIAAMKWYGLSNARPQASAMPFTDFYSPAWVGNGYNRFEWIGGGPGVTFRVDGDGYRR